MTGVDDDVDDDDMFYTVELKVAASSDGNYSGLSPSLLTGSNQDDDTAGVTVIGASSLSTSETGTTASFQVELDSEPLNTVSISLDSNDLGEVSVINPASGALSFNSSNWNDLRQLPSAASMIQCLTETGASVYRLDQPRVMMASIPD